MKILSINEFSLISGGADEATSWPPKAFEAYADYFPTKETIRYAAAATIGVFMACAIAYKLKPDSYIPM